MTGTNKAEASALTKRKLAYERLAMIIDDLNDTGDADIAAALFMAVGMLEERYSPYLGVETDAIRASNDANREN